MEEKMKDSGIKWIGQIPENWGIKKLKYCVRKKITDGPHETPVFIDDGVIFLSVDSIQDGKIKFENTRYISYEDAKKYDKKCKLEKNDVLIGKAASTGKIAIVDKDVYFQVWSPLAVVKTNSNILYSNYLRYYLLSPSGQENIDNFCTMNTQKNIAMEDIERLLIVIPSLEEQKKIAKFLDKKCADIDEIISKTEEQIEVLEKYKKSLIREIVTKGLNKNVELKNSGIQWIGNIPKEWDIYNLKHLFRMYAGGDVDEYDFSNTFSQQTPYPIYSNSLEKNGLLGYMSKYRFKGKTFTVTGRGDVGKAIARNDSYFPVVRLLVCVPMFGDDTRYFTYCVNSADLFGDQTAMAQLTTQRLGLNKFPRPTFIEQKKISDFLDVECQKINEVITKQKESLETLKKYKQSLIYEYVTGKKRV